MDVKKTFLNGVIGEEVYIEQPKGFEVHDTETHVCRLNRALYGLKQAPCAWYSQINCYLLKMGFTKSDANTNLFFIMIRDEPLILVLYVDDMFLKNSENLISRCKKDLALEFKMKDIGLMNYFLGLDVE